MKIIAYGSLMNQKSLEKTLGRSAKLRKIKIRGWVRVFNAPFHGYAFLNLQKCRDKTIEVAYFEIESNEIKKFTKREAGSGLVEVEPDYFAFIWPTDKCRNLPVLQNYIDVCEIGAHELKVDLLKNIILPKTIFDDRQNPKYL